MVYRLEKCEKISCAPRAGNLIDLTNPGTVEREREKERRNRDQRESAIKIPAGLLLGS